jgi:hypothetical protein
MTRQKMSERLASEIVKSILLTAFDGEALYTIFAGDPVVCWFHWSGSDSMLAELAAVGIDSKDGVLRFVSDALESFPWPRSDAPDAPACGSPFVFTMVAEAPESPQGASAHFGFSDKRLLGKELLIYCVRPADLRVGPFFSAEGVRELCERFKCHFDQFNRDTVSLPPNSSPFGSAVALAAGVLAAIQAPRGVSIPSPQVSLDWCEWEKCAPECLVVGDDVEANVCVVSPRLRTHKNGVEDQRLFVTTKTYSGLASMGWVHDSATMEFSDAERAVFADRFAILRVYCSLREHYKANPWALVVDWLNLKVAYSHDSHQRALAKAQFFVGNVALAVVRDTSYCQAVLARAIVKGDAAEQIIRLVASLRIASLATLRGTLISFGTCGGRTFAV